LYSELINQFYSGSTSDLADRFFRHNAGQEKSTHKGVLWVLVWQKEFLDRASAVQLELKIKKRGAKRFLQDLKIVNG
jgi:putative endonuclease